MTGGVTERGLSLVLDLHSCFRVSGRRLNSIVCIKWPHSFPAHCVIDLGDIQESINSDKSAGDLQADFYREETKKGETSSKFNYLFIIFWFLNLIIELCQTFFSF